MPVRSVFNLIADSEHEGLAISVLESLCADDVGRACRQVGFVHGDASVRGEALDRARALGDPVVVDYDFAD